MIRSLRKEASPRATAIAAQALTPTTYQRIHRRPSSRTQLRRAGRLFAKFQNYEHSLNRKSAITGETVNERGSANHTKPNTAPTAKRELSAEGVSDRSGGRAVDRGCTQARSQRAKGCCRDPASVSAWAACGRALSASLVTDRSEARSLVNRAKGGCASVHPLHGPKLRALRPLQGESPYVFVTEAGTPVTPAWFLRMVQRTGRAAKLPFPVHPHMLRHSTGYKLANDGHDTRSLAHYLGHRNLQSTARYTALAPDRFKGFWRD